MTHLATAEEAANPDNKFYHPFGGCLAFMRCRAPEVVLSGPAGTGKSIAALNKIHACCDKYAGARVLIVRKTRVSLTESALVSWEEKVIPVGHPILKGASRAMRQAYQYPNGSTVVTGGMDNTAKIFSTEYDLIYVQEAIELTENDWESLTTRLRNGVMPYQQIIADTNPDSPTHWLKQRAVSGKTLMLESRHEDNPTLWDGTKKEWTPTGAVYLSKLDALTGPRRDRLAKGKWVQAEGAIYDGWDAAVHLIDRFEIVFPRWTRWWVVDFGYTHPFVWQEWVEDDDGRLYRTKEIYMTHRLVEDHARRILEITKGEPRPRAILCDHDAEDRATLARHLGMDTVAAEKEVSPGIQAVAARLRKAGDGKPRLFLMRDSLDERDPILMEAKKPTCTEEEVGGYIWSLTGGRRKGEEPLKEDDHGCDCMRYMVAELDLRAAEVGFEGVFAGSRRAGR